MFIKQAQWIGYPEADAAFVPVFRRDFDCDGPVARAWLEITAAGVYEAVLNGRRVGRFVLAPGWTEYGKRLQVQRYEITDLLQGENSLEVIVGNGWMRRENPAWSRTESAAKDMPALLIACVRIQYVNGTEETIPTDARWTAARSNISVSGIFDGETVDAGAAPSEIKPAKCYEYSKEILVPQQGCEVIEQEVLFPTRVFHTPKGEWVVDFGQNLTGYMAFECEAKAGERLCFSTAEVLDRQGNFYTENYRGARSRLEYTCKAGRQSYKPRLTFFGFRYLRLDEAPEGFDPKGVRAIVVHSDMARTGWLASGDPLLDRFFRNVVWGQKGNFLDIPTDCPQRDERLGWTGDAQTFARTASYNFDVRQFFKKWLADLRLAQGPDGWVPDVVPNILPWKKGSAAWGDAATIIPWQMYMTYGDADFLRDQFDSMRKWVDFITSVTTTPCLWTGGEHYGDWLGLDAREGSYKGASDDDLIASAFYAHSTGLVVKAGRIIGRDVSHYAALHDQIVKAFRTRYGDRLNTQTEKVIALEFELAEHPQAVADALAEQIAANGTALQTGFVGTPYLLRVLSRYGHTALAYALLLRREYPSWLYPVTKGATTVWEHWDGIKPDGSFWSSDMNSFNHYSYGAVTDWVYEYACGIRAAEPGFRRAIIAPQPDDRVESLSARLKTVSGEIYSAWRHQDGRTQYEIRVDMPAEIHIEGTVYHLDKGHYFF